MKLTQKTRSTPKRVLIYGPPKSGKSYLAGKLAEAFNLIWIDMEKGHSVLFQLPEEWQERIDVIEIPDTRAFPMAIQTCLKMVKGQPGTICEKHGTWNCLLCKKDNLPVVEINLGTLGLDTIVVWDSGTQLTNSAIAHITKAQPDDYKMEYDDWANLGKLMDTFLGHLQQAGYHVVVISHETEAKLEDGKDKLVPTFGTRNFSRNSAKYFDEVVYCEVKGKKHVAASSTLYNGNILTGSRTGAVLERESEASLIPIFKGEVKPQSIVNTDTPGTKALTSLSALRAKMAGTST